MRENAVFTVLGSDSQWRLELVNGAGLPTNNKKAAKFDFSVFTGS